MNEPYEHDVVCANCGYARCEHQTTTATGPGSADAVVYICPIEEETTFVALKAGDKPKSGSKDRNPIKEKVDDILGRLGGSEPDVASKTIAIAGAMILEKISRLIRVVTRRMPLDAAEDRPTRKVASKIDKDDQRLKRVGQALDIAIERLVTFANPILLATRDTPITANQMRHNLFLEVNKRNNEVTVEMTTRISDKPPTP